MVTVDEEVAGFGLKFPVMPAGQFDVVSVTGELKILTGTTVTVDDPLDPAATDVGVAVSEKPCTVRKIDALDVSAPETPFTTSEYWLTGTLEATLMVTMDKPVAGFVPNVPVIPAGQLEVDSVTGELNPPSGLMTSVEVPLPAKGTFTPVAPMVKEPCVEGLNVSVPSCCHVPD